MEQPGQQPAHGFSLIEVIGALAIMALLAAALVPRLIKKIDLATRAQEVANLAAIRDGLQLGVVRSNNIPDVSGWASMAAYWSAFPEVEVYSNSRRYARIYFTQTSPRPTLPYTQTVAGTAQPSNLRAVIVSTLGGDTLTAANCPNPAGGALSAADFNVLWNLADGTRPTTGQWANWNGSADDFLVQRVDYAPLFHQLLLLNRDSNFLASFRISGSDPVMVTNGTPFNTGWSAYYLDGTVVGLCDVNGMPLTRYTLTRDIGYVFEDRLWRAQIMGLTSNNSQADTFANNAAQFLAAQWYTGAHQGGDQQGALTAMYSFMYTYTLWANQCPHFPWHNAASAVQVPEYEMLSDIGDNNARLDEFTGKNGLLK